MRVMKILQVAHSFVPYVFAGTEVYAYKLSKQLLRRHKVFVFFRIKDFRKKEYLIERGNLEGLETYSLNHTLRFCRSFAATYNDEAIDKEFGSLLDEIRPDVVHIHHLLFLSHGIVSEIKKRKIPVLYTLHDYWLICHRGQMVRDGTVVCGGGNIVECKDCLRYLLSIRKYALYLYSVIKKYLPPRLMELVKGAYPVLSGDKLLKEIEDLNESVGLIYAMIDVFTAPSHFIRERFIIRGFAADKIRYSPYGLDQSSFIPAKRSKSGVVTFGYLGTLLPSKGVDILIAAFKRVRSAHVRLSLYGKMSSYIGFESYLCKLKRAAATDSRISFKGPYDNKEISSVLSGMDVLVVPSVWPENAPLVIQEAFLAKVPVIASRIGGIPELVTDRVNGLLFSPGHKEDLRSKMQYIIDNPEVLDKFRENAPQVKSIEENARELEVIYAELIANKKNE